MTWWKGNPSSYGKIPYSQIAVCASTLTCILHGPKIASTGGMKHKVRSQADRAVVAVETIVLISLTCLPLALTFCKWLNNGWIQFLRYFLKLINWNCKRRKSSVFYFCKFQHQMDFSDSLNPWKLELFVVICFNAVVQNVDSTWSHDQEDAHKITEASAYSIAFQFVSVHISVLAERHTVLLRLKH